MYDTTAAVGGCLGVGHRLPDASLFFLDSCAVFLSAFVCLLLLSFSRQCSAPFRSAIATYPRCRTAMAAFSALAALNTARAASVGAPPPGTPAAEHDGGAEKAAEGGRARGRPRLSLQHLEALCKRLKTAATMAERRCVFCVLCVCVVGWWGERRRRRGRGIEREREREERLSACVAYCGACRRRIRVCVCVCVCVCVHARVCVFLSYILQRKGLVFVSFTFPFFLPPLSLLPAALAGIADRSLTCSDFGASHTLVQPAHPNMAIEY